MQAEDRLREARLEHLRSEVTKGVESGPDKAWNPEEVRRTTRARHAETHEPCPGVVPLAPESSGRRPGRLAGRKLDAAFVEVLSKKKSRPGRA